MLIVDALRALSAKVTAQESDANDIAGVINDMAQGFSLPKATAQTVGGVKQGVAVNNAAAAPTQEEFNALLTSLRNAGIIAGS